MHTILRILGVLGALALGLFVAVGGGFVLVYVAAFIGTVAMVGLMAYSAFAGLGRWLHHGWPALHVPHLRIGRHHGNIRAA
jgi:hypothetical protein